MIPIFKDIHSAIKSDDSIDTDPDSIQAIAQQLSIKTGVSASLITLSYRSRMLYPDKTIEFYNIQRESTLNATARCKISNINSNERSNTFGAFPVSISNAQLNTKINTINSSINELNKTYETPIANNTEMNQTYPEPPIVNETYTEPPTSISPKQDTNNPPIMDINDNNNDIEPPIVNASYPEPATSTIISPTQNINNEQIENINDNNNSQQPVDYITDNNYNKSIENIHEEKPLQTIENPIETQPQIETETQIKIDNEIEINDIPSEEPPQEEKEKDNPVQSVTFSITAPISSPLPIIHKVK